MMKATTQNTSKRFPAIGLAAAMLLAVTGFAGPLHAADVYLQAQRFEKTLTRPDASTETVQMWGFASCTDAAYTSCVIDSPGSQIRVTAGDELNIHLTNTLDTPVSIVIPGQVGGGDPTTMSSDTRRVQSFTQEVAANTPSTPVTYTWSAVRPGTYLYQSGTQPSLQVPMGLYGALVVGPDVLDLDYVNSVIADLAETGYYYRLGEAAVTDPAVDEVGGSDGTYGTNVTPGLSLGYGTDKAAGFNATANDYVDTGVDMLSDTAFSVEAWVNANDTAGQHRIVAKDELGVFGQFVLWFNSGKLRFQVYPSDGTLPGDWAIAEAPTAPPVGTTFHVVGVFDGTDVILYVDGTKVASTELGAATAITNSLPITIGASSLGMSSRDHIFDGSIDEVAIYESALTEGQIAEHFVANSYESVLLFSEIDPLQNGRVAYAEANAAGTPTQACVALADYIPMDGGYPCTIDYNPLYFLTNGEAAADLSAGAPGNSVRLSLLNAGLRTHTPSIVGLEMAVIAEDGNAYPGLPRRQSQALLPAGKTLEMFIGVDDGSGNLVMPAGVNANYSLFDRMPTFSNESAPANGGSLTSLQVGTGTPSGPPPEQTYFEEVYAVTEDTTLRIDPTGGNGVVVISDPSNGEIVEVTVGGVLMYDYTPNPDFSGTDSFIYQRNIGHTYLATLNVSFENDAPVAAGDGPYNNAVGTAISIDAAHGVLGNDTDVDGDALTAVLDAPVTGLMLSSDGSFTYSGAAATAFSYHAFDGVSNSASSVTVNIDYRAPSTIALTVQEPDGTIVPGYRWTVEEDTTWQPVPGVSNPESLGTNFHSSYMPVVAQGCEGCTPQVAENDINVDPSGDFPGPGDIDYNGDELVNSSNTSFSLLALDSSKHYYVSVLPLDAMVEAADGYRVGHTIGGARIMPGASAVTVIVNEEPLPYAQISIIVFEDSGPTNAAIDGNESGLGGFQITLEDAGGRYGISAGTMSQDADANPLTNSLGLPPNNCFGGATPAPGIILTCPDLDPTDGVSPLAGQVLIKNLFPGKYGVIATPAVGSENQWVQTSTIEGTKVIDAWVKAGEPEFFSEFGPAGWHVFIGFMSPELANAKNTVGGSNIVSGNITNNHMARPPVQTLFDSESYDALAHTRAWVGLNSEGGIGTNIATVQADADGSFSIPNVPDGEYQLVVWDSYLDQVIAYKAVSLPGEGNLKNVPVFQWFARLENNVFLDEDEDGVFDAGELPLSEQAVNLRWRDGSVYQSFPTDLEGFVPFDQVFPFFNWLVAEVDYTRFKATGLTVTVDDGGKVSDTGNVLKPQQQGPCTQDDVDNDWNGCAASGLGSPYANPNSRTETGAVLTQGFQGFLGQTSVFDWGKKPYVAGENGGISGIVYYGVTRAESDPRLAAAEPWEPGIPRVTLRLYREVATSSNGTEADGTGLVLVTETTTDSWDDNLPVNCPGADSTDPVTPLDKCYDGLRNFNQARPAVFDGGYAFNDIPAGTYVVEVVPPPGYTLMKEEDVNVSFGDGYAAVFQTMPGGAAYPLPDPAMIEEALAADAGLAQPECVGDLREVPQTLSLFPAMNVEAPFRGSMRPLCDRKQVILSDQGQAAADFTIFTSTPVAGHFAGMVLDDVAQEFNPLSIQFGEKWAPPFVPVSIRDYKGNEISRVYSDEWGRMNGLVPSTFTAFMPSPSGFSPAMHMTCMNDPGPLADGSIDPQYNPAYSNFCYTFQYMPGTTTYLDTPVLPVASFASGYNPADCALDEGTPMIREVSGGTPGAGPVVASGGTLTITSMGTTTVPNPAYEGPVSGTVKTIDRDYGFGGIAGSVTIGGEELTGVSWDDGVISGTVPGTATTGQLVVTHANGNSTEHAITVTVGTVNGTTTRYVMAGGSIQAKIDIADPGDLILVAPGVYNESVIMWKPVRLQGAGAGSTLINAVKRPTERLAEWRDKMDSLFDDGFVDSLTNQPRGAIGFENSEGAGITVLGLDNAQGGQDKFKHYGGNGPRPPARIDGFSITGADVGGGIMVNGYADNLEISNNHVFGNAGLYHGGIRIGQPFLELELPNGNTSFAFNDGVNVHHNSITQNGGLGGAGGGLSITTGTDNYTVSNNYVCGNFTTADGGGIGHLGLSDGGMIKNNRIVLNQSFNQGISVSGGGLFIGGEPQAGALTMGSGSVTVDANLIQGNQAGAGHGGGIRTQFVNGQEMTNSAPGLWNTVTLTNNMVVNNVAGWSGAGIALQDTLRSFIVNNTIAHNDSTATVGALVSANISEPQPAGLSSMAHSILLEASIPNSRAEYRGFSNPIQLVNNIAWQNRAFHYDASLPEGGSVLQPDLVQMAVGECLATTAYWDMGVLGGVHALSPTYSVLSTTDGTALDPTNTMDDPDLADVYCNGGRALATGPGSILALPALDEGGNAWIDVRYGPLTQTRLVMGDSESWDYHIKAGSTVSSALGNGSLAEAPDLDFDGDKRPLPELAPFVDRGADEVLDDVVYVPPTDPGTVAYSTGAFGEVLTNSTAAELIITATVSGDDVDFGVITPPNLASPFAITGGDCAGIVLAEDTCDITVTFTPTAPGAVTDSFTVASDAIDILQTVHLTGTGVTNIVTINPDPGLFGVVPVGTTEKLTFVATVEGSIAFDGAAVTGDGYAIDPATSCTGVTCSVVVSYTPATATESNGVLTITSDGTDQHIVLLEAGGVAPATVTYSPNPGDFGDVPVGETATLTIEALVAGITVTFDSAALPTGPFAIISDGCTGNTLSDGAACNFDVQYTPTPTGGSESETLTVTNNAVGGSQTVDLTGNGLVAEPGTVSVSPSPLDFGNINRADVTSPVTFTVGGGTAVTFGAATVTNEGDGEGTYTLDSDECIGQTVAVGGSCTVWVTLDMPGGGNTRSDGTLTVLHDGTGSSSTLSLTGR